MALNNKLNFEKLDLIHEHGRTWICDKNMEIVAFNSDEDLRDALNIIGEYIEQIKNTIIELYRDLKYGIELYGLEHTIRVLHDCVTYEYELDDNICEAIYRSENIDEHLLKYELLKGNKWLLDKCASKSFPMCQLDENFIAGSDEIHDNNNGYYYFDRTAINTEILKQYLIEDKYEAQQNYEEYTDEWIECQVEYVSKIIELIETEIIELQND